MEIKKKWNGYSVHVRTQSLRALRREGEQEDRKNWFLGAALYPCTETLDKLEIEVLVHYSGCPHQSQNSNNQSTQ